MKQQKLLIVEDEVIISANLEDSLRKLGYSHIETASGAYQALDMLHKNEFDVVLMDVKLNDEIDGIDVIQQVKQKKDLQVIYVTGNSDDYTVAKAKKTLPSGFITKPVTDHNLKIQLQLLLYREEKQNRLDVEQAGKWQVFNSDLSGLKMSLYFDGTILSASPNIKKLTGVPCYKYAGVYIAKAVFGNDFFHLLCEILDETLISDKRTFYGKVFSPYLGIRMLCAEVSYLPGQLVEIQFTDLSSKLNLRTNVSGHTVAVASSVHETLKNAASLNAICPGIQIEALLPDEESLLEYLSTKNDGILMLDIRFHQSKEVVKKLMSKPFVKKIIMASPIEEHEELQSITLEAYDGYISKGAADSTVIEMLQQIQRDGKFFDRSLVNFID